MENTVTLLSYNGGDESHALSAWQSTSVDCGVELPDDVKERISTLFKAVAPQKKKDVSGLLTMLATLGHHTPFENSQLMFQVTADIASHIHCLKHRIGVSINTESARYKELRDKHYIPTDWDDEWQERLQAYAVEGERLYHDAVKSLSKTLGRKRAKETARYFLGYNKQVTFGMTFNFRSFQHFYGLRSSCHAQVEIQEIALLMMEQVRKLPEFQYSLAAFDKLREIEELKTKLYDQHKAQCLDPYAN